MAEQLFLMREFPASPLPMRRRMKSPQMLRRIKMAAECVVLGGLGVGTDHGRRSAAGCLTQSRLCARWNGSCIFSHSWSVASNGARTPLIRQLRQLASITIRDCIARRGKLAICDSAVDNHTGRRRGLSKRNAGT